MVKIVITETVCSSYYRASTSIIVKAPGTWIMLISLALSQPIVVNGFVNDSTKDTANTVSQRKAHYRINARVHSLGVFGYGGMIANANPAFDFNFSYQRKRYNVIVSKAVDLYDVHSNYNFALVMVNTRLPITSSLTFIPYAGFVIQQNERFIGKHSDGMVFLIATWKHPDGVTMEHCARFSNTCIETENFDWLNRIRLTYSYHHIDVVGTLWHNNNVFDQNKHTSLGLSLGYGRVTINDHISLSSSLTGIKMTASTDEHRLAEASGLSLTIAATWD